MRVFITIQPAFGHLHPLLPFARALKSAGHEVAFASGQSFCKIVEANGFKCFPAGANDAVFAGTTAERMLTDLLPLARAESPTIIIHDVTEWGGYLAAELLGLPHVSVQVGAHCPPEPPWQGVAVEIERLRQLGNLVSDPDLRSIYRYLHLCTAPPSYQRLGRIPATTLSVRRMARYCSTRLMPCSPSRYPTIYATLGTVSNQRPEVFQTIIDAFKDGPVNLIMTIGFKQDPQKLRVQSRNIVVERYICHLDVLPYCDLVITHGGYSTVLDAMEFGLPMLIIPLFADQPENARRCAQLGIADTIDAGTLSVAKLRETTCGVLSDFAYRNNARRIRSEFFVLPAMDAAVHAIEKLASFRRGL